MYRNEMSSEQLVPYEEIDSKHGKTSKWVVEQDGHPVFQSKGQSWAQ